MRKSISIMTMVLVGFMFIAARGDGGGCGGMMDSSHMDSSNMCNDGENCGDDDRYPDSNPPPDDPPQEQCFIRVILDEADADLASDLYLDVNPSDLLFDDTLSSVGEFVERDYDGYSDLVFFIEVQDAEGPYIVTSDSEWAETTVISDKEWTIGFEDMPFEEKSDFDYNDAVISIETINCE